MKYSEMDDAKLIELTRKGNMAAYAALWERHAKAGLKVANSFSRTIDPDDLVSEAYVNILETINRGHGPTTDFRPYLLGTVRNIVSRVATKSKEDTIEDLEAVVDARQNGGVDTLYTGLDNKALVLDAFSRLTLQEQTILWRAEIEGLKHREIAAIDGTSVGAASVALFRARESLKDAWVQAHLSAGNCPKECERAFSQLGAYSRKRLKKKESVRVKEHLEQCDFCPRVLSETQEISSKLHISLVPTALVASGAIGVGAISAVTGGLHATAAAAMTVKTTGALSALSAYSAGYTPAIAAVAGATVVVGSLVGVAAVAPELFPTDEAQTSSESVQGTTGGAGSGSTQNSSKDDGAEGEASAGERQNDDGTNADSSNENQTGEGPTGKNGDNDSAAENGPTSEDPKLDLLLPDWWKQDQGITNDGIHIDKIHDGSLSKSLTFGFPAGTSFSTARPLLVGQAHPGDRVQVFVYGFTGEYSRDTVANAVGGWSLQVGNLSGESYFADISVTDAKGIVVDRNVMKFGVHPDAGATPPVISGVDLDGPIRTVTGKGTPGATVRLYVNDLVTEGYVTDKGVWTIQVERGWKQLLNVLTAVQVNPNTGLTSEVGKPLLVWAER